MAVSISQLGRLLRAGDTTATELTERTLAAVEALDGELHAFVLVDAHGAREAAAAADAAIEQGSGGPLCGIPVAIKDIIDVAGQPTRCGSTAYDDAPRRHDATVVTRLRAAGAVIIGKTTSHELACGVYSAPARNPWDTTRLPGGSSGGSGAAVAAGLVPVALGSDTGGSIRIPAAVCGIAGLKPTYGLVPRTGVEPLSWSLDHLGPLGATVEDCAVTLQAIAGPDPADPTTRGAPPNDVTARLGGGLGGVRIGVVRSGPFRPLADDVAEAFEDAAASLDDGGADLVEVRVPELDHTLAAEFAIVGPEAAAYHRSRLRERPEDIDPAIRSLLVNGTLQPAADYLRGGAARVAIRDGMRRVFEEHRLDVVVCPTLPATAAGHDQTEFEFDGLPEDVTAAYVRTTAPFNLSGQPALSLPCGVDRHGLPIGLQVAGRPFDEAMVIQVGAAFERLTPWTTRRPRVHVEAA